MITDPLIGRRLSNFLIERVIGRGGMAQVYYGQDVKLQRPVAIKVIDARHRNNPNYAQRFVKEARAVARWRHENIIQIYYADDQDGLYYYVMEYIDGQDLSSYITAHATHGDEISSAEIVRIGRAIANALDYAHSQGVIHRDVKPSNVFLSKDGRVVLGDFGLALDLQQGSSGEALGTPHYISPEQVRRSTDAIAQSDLYSLGIILYEMLTGVVPFDDISPTSVALQHLTQAPPPPRSLNPQISAETEAVLLKALSKNPKDRYQSGRELIDALEKALAKVPPTSERVLPLPPMPAAILAGKTRPITRKIETSTQPVPPRQRWPLFLALFVLLFVTVLISADLLAPDQFSALIFPSSATPLSTSTDAHRAVTVIPPVTIALTRTFTPTATVTRTPRLSATSTATPSQTVTATQTTSATDAPTVAPTLTVAETLAATFTATTGLVLSPTSTQQFPNLKRMWLYYDQYGFYIYNASSDNRSISPMAFERIDTSEATPNRFIGATWAEFYATLSAKRCMRIEIQKNPGNYLNPAVCKDYYLSTRSIAADNTFIFWTATSTSTQFRVLWQGQEVGLCDIQTGFCEVFVP